MGSVRGEKTFQTRCQVENCWWGGTQEIMYFLKEQWWVVNPVSTTRILCGTCKYYGWGVVCEPPTEEKHEACFVDYCRALTVTNHCVQVILHVHVAVIILNPSSIEVLVIVTSFVAYKYVSVYTIWLTGVVN